MKRFLALLLALVFASVGLPSYGSIGAPNESCLKIGQVVKYKKTQLTCTSLGDSSVWQLGLSAAKKYNPGGYSGTRCSEDPKIKGIGSKIQAHAAAFSRCVGPMRIVKTLETKNVPISTVSPDSKYADLRICQKVNVTPTQSWKGFPADSKKSEFKQERHPAPGTVMQVVPIYSSDAPTTGGTPYKDYKFYFDFIKDYFSYINDGTTAFDLRVPEKYFEFSKPIKPYEIRHGKDDDKSKQFGNDVIAAVDQEFDFSKSDYVLIVVPAGTPSSIIGQQGFGDVMSAEGRLFNVAVAQPASFFAKNNNKTPEMTLPIMWLHEFYHPGINLGDNHGSNSFKYDDGRGMGDWGLMSRSNGDLLVWQKWLLGFLQDSQVYCLDGAQKTTTTSLVSPSTTKTTKHKLLAISVGSSKVLVVESIRPSGINYKLEKKSLGALVYLVDTSEPGHEDGYTLMYPDSRRPKYSWPYMPDAPLKLGESLTYEGVKITNVEWGEFGDVIRVEPAS